MEFSFFLIAQMISGVLSGNTAGLQHVGDEKRVAQLNPNLAALARSQAGRLAGRREEKRVRREEFGKRVLRVRRIGFSRVMTHTGLR